jgi:DNA-binding CsgD family transcriptional regulator
MKTRPRGLFARKSVAMEQAPTPTSDIDALANEIFAQLNNPDGNNAAEDLRLYLIRAASALVRPSGTAQAVVNATLQSLPSSQREALLLHLGGLTCAQIAQRQGRAHRAALQDLTSAYMRLRFSLDPQTTPNETQLDPPQQ